MAFGGRRPPLVCRKHRLFEVNVQQPPMIRSQRPDPDDGSFSQSLPGIGEPASRPEQSAWIAERIAEFYFVLLPSGPPEPEST
jgi:hypothetical protein